MKRSPKEQEVIEEARARLKSEKKTRAAIQIKPNLTPVQAECVTLLRAKARPPPKADMSEFVVKIKAVLSPWPRALEKVGLKEVSQTYLNRKTRQRSKRKQNYKKKGRRKRTYSKMPEKRFI